MDGQGVFKFAVRKVPEIIEEVLEETGNSLEEIDYFILHQANRRIIEAVAKRLKTDIAKFPMNLEEYANTSAATVPILIDEMNRKGMFEKGQKDHDGRIRCRDLPGRQACLSGKATNYGNLPAEPDYNTLSPHGGAIQSPGGKIFSSEKGKRNHVRENQRNRSRLIKCRR